MSKREESINQVESAAADERLRVALTAAYAASEASSQLRGRVGELAAGHAERARRSGARWRPGAAFGWRCAGMIAVVGAIYIGLTFTSPGRSTPAFAQVEQAMREIKTAHWVQKRTLTGADGSLIYEAVSDVWVRMNPLAKAVRSLPQTFRTAPNESLHNTRYVIDRRGQVTYNATTGEYTINPNALPRGLVPGGKAEEILRAMILGEVLSPAEVSSPLFDKKDSLPKIGRMTIPAWTSERVTIAGRPLVKFYREFSYAGYSSGTVKLAIWTDPQTNRVVRSEFRTTGLGANGWDRLIVNEQYRYDEEPPKGTFDLTPPGARVKVMNRPTWALSPQTLSAVDLQKAQKIIDHSETAWRRDDFEAFAAVWNFDFNNKLINLGTAPAGAARRRDWKRRIEWQRGRWSRWESRIDVDSARQYVSDAARINPQKMDQIKPDILMVEVTSRGAWAEDGDTWDGKKATYFLRREKDGFRIVNWQTSALWSYITSEHKPRKSRSETEKK